MVLLPKNRCNILEWTLGSWAPDDPRDKCEQLRCHTGEHTISISYCWMMLDFLNQRSLQISSVLCSRETSIREKGSSKERNSKERRWLITITIIFTCPSWSYLEIQEMLWQKSEIHLCLPRQQCHYHHHFPQNKAMHSIWLQ